MAEKNKMAAEMVEILNSREMSNIENYLKGSAAGFVRGMRSKVERYGENIFASQKQLSWMRDIQKKYGKCWINPDSPEGQRKEMGIR